MGLRKIFPLQGYQNDTTKGFRPHAAQDGPDLSPIYLRVNKPGEGEEEKAYGVSILPGEEQRTERKRRALKVEIPMEV